MASSTTDAAQPVIVIDHGGNAGVMALGLGGLFLIAVVVGGAVAIGATYAYNRMAEATKQAVSGQGVPAGETTQDE